MSNPSPIKQRLLLAGLALGLVVGCGSKPVQKTSEETEKPGKAAVAATTPTTPETPTEKPTPPTETDTPKGLPADLKVYAPAGSGAFLVIDMEQISSDLSADQLASLKEYSDLAGFDLAKDISTVTVAVRKVPAGLEDFPELVVSLSGKLDAASAPKKLKEVMKTVGFGGVDFAAAGDHTLLMIVGPPTLLEETKKAAEAPALQDSPGLKELMEKVDAAKTVYGGAVVTDALRPMVPPSLKALTSVTMEVDLTKGLAAKVVASFGDAASATAAKESAEKGFKDLLTTAAAGLAPGGPQAADLVPLLSSISFSGSDKDLSIAWTLNEEQWKTLQKVTQAAPR